MEPETVRSVPDGVRVETDRGAFELQVIDDAVVRVVGTLTDDESDTGGRATDADEGDDAAAAPSFTDPESLMVVEQSPGDADWSLIETAAGYELVTDALRVEIDADTGALTWRDADGDLLTREPDGGGKTLDPVDVSDLALGEDVAGPPETTDREAYATKVEFEFADDEAIYGLGQHEEGIGNYRGSNQYLYQENTKVSMPAIVSTRGYGVLWDSYSLSTFHDDGHGSYVWTECDDELDYYFVYGPEFDDVVSGFRTLTGDPAMLPRWAYGYVQSRERYTTADELRAVVDEYREREVPLDCIVQDWQYWPDTTADEPDFSGWGGPAGEWGRWGEKEFHPERFPDPAALMDDLHDENVRLMISLWPNMLTGPNHREMEENGFLLDDADVEAPDNERHFYDVFDDDARELYWEQADEGLFSHGVDAWWCDSTEPYNPDWAMAVRPEPFERTRLVTDALKSVIDPEYINAYSIMQAKGMYEGQRATGSDKRVTNLTRSGYPGQHRYGAVTWSGDVEATWERLERQIAAGLMFTVTGNPKWTLDIGGFFVEGGFPWFVGGDYPEGHEDDGYRELYTRWFQFGAFLPMFRSHGTDTPREVWQFGEEGERVYDTLVTFDRLRYRLLPYLYSLAGMETHDDYTMFRHLAFDFRGDDRVHDVTDQFMCGPAFMVCPVTEPMYYGPESTPIEGAAKAREVYLPEGTDWYDFWTGTRYEGGREVLADAPLEKVPLFVRAGSIVPMGPHVQHTGEKPDAPWELRVYPGRDGAFDVYEDAGDGYDYEDGAFARTPLRWDDAAGALRVEEREGSFPELTEEREFRVVRVGEGRGVGVDPADADARTAVAYDGSETTVTPDAAADSDER